MGKKQERASSLFDDIDIKILHQLLKNKQTILELANNATVSHSILKKHLIKLLDMNLVNIEEGKGRQIIVSFNHDFDKLPDNIDNNPMVILGYIIYQSVQAGKNIYKDAKTKQAEKLAKKNKYTTLTSIPG